METLTLQRNQQLLRAIICLRTILNECLRENVRNGRWVLSRLYTYCLRYSNSLSTVIDGFRALGNAMVLKLRK